MILLLTIKALSWLGSKKLLEHTTVRDYSRTQSAYEQVVAEVSPNPTKKEKRMNHKLPMLPVERLEGKEEEHVIVNPFLSAKGLSKCDSTHLPN